MNYATVLFYDGNVIGSGTFVECNSQFGILTAHHVIREGIGFDSFGSSSAKKLGVAIATNYYCKPELELQYTQPHEIGKPHDKYNEFGPDLIFLEILDREKLGTIKACSSFWNMPSQNNLVNDCYNDSSCIWAVCGLPQNWIYEMPSSNFDKVIGCQVLIGFGGVERRFDKDGFDYFDVAVDCNPQNDIPHTFKGMSGGGLWKILLSCTGNLQDLKVSDSIFSGVIFYQTELKQNRRVIRSHGAKSIYEIFPRLLEKNQT
jgi:hypothetical protein